MIRSFKTRRAAITLATTALVVSAVLGSNPGMSALGTPTPGKTQHSVSKVVSYVPGQPLIVTIEHPYYDNTSYVAYGEIQNVFGQPVVFLLPMGGLPAVATNKKGQAVKGNRITVAFDTTTVYSSDPTKPGASTIAFPTLGSGSILLIHTSDHNTDIPVPIALEQVPLSTV